MEHVSCRDVTYHMTKLMMTVNEVAMNAPKMFPTRFVDNWFFLFTFFSCVNIPFGWKLNTANMGTKHKLENTVDVRFPYLRLLGFWIVWRELRKLTNGSNLRVVLWTNRSTNLSPRLENNPWIFHLSSTSELMSPRLVFGREQFVTDFRQKRNIGSIWDPDTLQ